MSEKNVLNQEPKDFEIVAVESKPGKVETSKANKPLKAIFTSRKSKQRLNEFIEEIVKAQDENE